MNVSMVASLYQTVAANTTSTELAPGSLVLHMNREHPPTSAICEVTQEAAGPLSTPLPTFGPPELNGSYLESAKAASTTEMGAKPASTLGRP